MYCRAMGDLLAQSLPFWQNCLEPLLITNSFFEDGCSLPGSCMVGRHQLPFPDGTG
jgi:hypothetical protein